MKLKTLIDPNGRLVNYMVTTNNGTLTIGQSSLTITALNTNKLYGQLVTFTGSEFTASGLVGSDAVTSVTLVSSGAGTGATVVGSPYPIMPSAAIGSGLANYNISYVNGVLTVARGPLSVTANNAFRAFGATNPPFNGMITGIQNTDNITATYATTATTNSPVGSYLIIPTLVDPDGKLANYLVTYNNGTLFIGIPPQITSQPTNQTVLLGGTAQFSVTATGQPTLTYQWWFNQTNLLSLATNSTLTLSNVNLAQAGGYSVVVMNNYDSVPSTTATLTVLSVPTISGFNYFFSSTNPVTGSRTVSLNATVNPNNLAAIAYFQYGLTASYSGSSALILLPAGNVGTNVSASLDSIVPGIIYHARAVASNSLGAAYTSDQTFSTASIYPPGDANGDGVVDQNELNAVLANYWPNSPWVMMTNVAGLGSTNVQFALTNANNWDFSVLVSTNLIDWQYLGPATPLYQYLDPSATNLPTRFYRLQWP